MVSPRLLPAVSQYQVSTSTARTSDHRIVSATLFQAKPKHVKSPQEALDTRLLRDPTFIDKIAHIIKTTQEKRAAHPSPETIGTYWERLKKTFLKEAKEFANKKRAQTRKDRGNQQQKLRAATVALDNHPNDPTLLQDIFEARQEIRALDQDKFERLKVLAKVKSVEENEQASPSFTARLKSKQNSRSIISLKDAQGLIHSDHEA
ncbi:hypothetical protein BGZ59_004202, partial [Podila verticillata]